MATIDKEISIKKRRRPGFPKEIEIIDFESDSFWFTPIKDKGNSKTNPISVEQYSDERDLRFAIKISNISPVSNFADLANYDDDLYVLDCEPPNTPFSKKREKEKKHLTDHSITGPGESSNSKANQDPSFVCEICVEPKQSNELFNIKGCSHGNCTDCVIKYVASKLQYQITAISCPVENCEGLLEHECCFNILPKEVFDVGGDAL